MPLHSDTQLLIDQLRSSSPQSILLSSTEGLGLDKIAQSISEGGEITSVYPDESKASKPITTEMVRRLYEVTRSRSSKRHFVIIHNADSMTHGAQGAFLKLLEEPNVATHFILTSSRPDVLLPTIRSRVQSYVIKKLTRKQSEDYLNHLGITNQTARQQLLYIADGLPEELKRLATDEEYFQASVQRIKDARSLLQAPLYDKLLVINSYRDNRANAIELVRFCTLMTRRSITQRPDQALVAQLEKLLLVSEKLVANRNVRLTLAQLVL